MASEILAPFIFLGGLWLAYYFHKNQQAYWKSHPEEYKRHLQEKQRRMERREAQDDAYNHERARLEARGDHYGR